MHSNTVVLLLGFEGTGKLTIAQSLAPTIGAKIVDNTSINNPIFSTIDTDGRTPLHPSIWAQTRKVREAVMHTIATLSPPNASFIFTYVGLEGDPYDRHSYELMLRTAERRKAVFVPVRLLCSQTELARRIAMPERKGRLKTTNPLAAIERSRTQTVLDPHHPNKMTLDVSARTAAESAEAIERHIRTLGNSTADRRGARKAIDNIAVRDARHDEASFIVQMIRHMVTDMVSHGGNAPATDDKAWEKIAAAIADELKGSNAKYLIAESPDSGPVGVAGAELITSGGAFAPKKTLHVSVLYVLPQFRRGGIGGRLMARILDWGRAAGNELCDLNVLSENPARSLYEKLGFSVLEVKMVRSL
jgi:ribosomal protein S18 acetylase RimI-like enzyme